MRLTNFLRDAFIRAAMHDVPKIDHQEKAEKIARDAIKDKFKKAFPMLDYDLACESGWFDDGSVKMPNNLNNIYAKAMCGYGMLQSDEKLWAKLETLSDQKREQDVRVRELESKLKGVAYACTTRKQLEEALPEFSSYLPTEEAKAAKTLPAVTGVVAEFTKAGWPAKGKK